MCFILTHKMFMYAFLKRGQQFCVCSHIHRQLIGFHKQVIVIYSHGHLFPPIDISMEIPMQDKDNSHVSLYSQDRGSSLTHHASDATSQIDDLTSEAAQGPASAKTHCPCCSYRRQED